MAYPSGFDSLPTPNYNQKMNASSPKHSADHQAVRDAVIALQIKVGIDSDPNVTSLDNRIYQLEQNPGGGAVWYVGTGVPSDGTGSNGDLYLNDANGDVYQKSAGTWGVPTANLIGPQGIQGIQGDPGTPGADGADGSVWREGTGAPSNGLGVDGDFYLNDTNGDVYQKSGGTYSVVANIKGAQGDQGIQGDPGAAGADGTDGSVWREGTGAPSNGLGVDGDFYLNDANGDVYQKAAGSYSVVANIKGPAGADGQDSVSGSVVYQESPTPSEWSVFDDLGATQPVSGDLYLNGWARATGNFLVNPSGGFGTVNTPGEARMATSTTIGTYGGWIAGTGTSAQPILLGGGRWRFGARFKEGTVSDGTNTFYIVMGFTQTLEATPPIGAYFQYSHEINGGKWLAVTDNTAAAATTTDTGVTYVSQTWHNFEIEVNDAGTQVLFYIDGVLKATHVASIPTATGDEVGPSLYIIKTFGPTARAINVDYLFLSYLESGGDRGTTAFHVPPSANFANMLKLGID